MFRTPTVLPETFWTARAERVERRRAARERLGLSHDDIALVYVGKLYAGKRVGDALSAVERIRARPGGGRLSLLVVGDGAGRRDLEAAAGAGVRFLGFVNVDALPDLYCASDALIHTAELEQYGMVVLEAAVLGLPLILSDRVGAIGATSIARPEVNALVYPCGDRDGLADCIARFLDEPGLSARLSAASLDIAEEHAGPTSVAAVDAAMRASLPGRRS